MAKPPPKVPEKADDKEQSERFIEAAREHETNEREDLFEAAFKKIASRQRRAQKNEPPRGS